MSSAVLGSYALAMLIASAAHAFDAVVPRTPRLLICVPFRIWSVYVPIWYTLNVWPASELPSAPFRVMVAPAAIADGASARPASMLAAAQAIAVTIIGMRRVVWLSLIPVFSFPCLHVLSRTGSDPTGRCDMVGVQRVESGDFHRGRPVFARLQTELAYRLRRTAGGNGRLRFLQRTCKIGLFQHFFGIYQSF